MNGGDFFPLAQDTGDRLVGGSTASAVRHVERALLVAAQLVAYHGDAYLPIFERLERELAALHRQTSAVERARTIAARAVRQTLKSLPTL
jgi:hypothetical protein